MRFSPSEGTVGVEYELQLVDADSLDLVDAICEVLQRLPRTPLIQPELVKSMIEITTPVCTGMHAVARALRDTVSAVWAECDQLRLRLAGAGTHPFCRRLGTITPLPRYLELASQAGILGQTQLIHALQVHVGLASGSEAVTAMQGLQCCLPILIALSASSPIWRGYDTGFASWRQRLLAATRTSGIPPRFEEWNAVETFFEAGARAAMFETWRDIHWDIRPRPDFGTIEMRVMDAPPTVTESLALAAFVRALTIYLVRTPPSHRPALLPRRLPRWVQRENHFQASRLALGAKYMTGGEPSVRSLREVVEATIDVVSPVADELGDGEYLDAVRERLTRRPSYARQREVWRATSSARAVVAALAHELEADLDVRRTASTPRNDPPSAHARDGGPPG